MADFNVRSDSVDVEQLMRQIRARIREKRGADYTEAEIRQLANVKLQKVLDPRGLRSDLVDQFRRQPAPKPSAALPKLEIKEFSIYGTHRGALSAIRRMLQPILKLFVNPQPLIHFTVTQANAQAEINDAIEKRLLTFDAGEQVRAERDTLYYEVIHNLVVEMTRLGIDVHNLKMQVESLSSRLDFDERRARSLESVVEYRPEASPYRAEPRQERPPQQSRPPRQPQGPRPDNRPRPDAARPDAPAQDHTRQVESRPNDGQTEAARPEGGRPEGGRPEGGNRPQGANEPGGDRRRRRRRRRRGRGGMLAGPPGAGGPQAPGAQGPQHQGGGEPAHDAHDAPGGHDDAHEDYAGPDDGSDDQGGQDAQ